MSTFVLPFWVRKSVAYICLFFCGSGRVNAPIRVSVSVRVRVSASVRVSVAFELGLGLGLGLGSLWKVELMLKL